jgi:hypothetical protein
MASFSDSKMLVGQSFSIMRKDKEILSFSLLSGILCSVVFIIFVYILINFFLFSDRDAYIEWHFYLLLFAFYFLIFFIVNFFNAGLATLVYMRLNGENPTFMDGINNSLRHIKSIFWWSILSSTVGVILKLMGKKVGPLANGITSILGISWGLFTFLVIPVMVIENKGVTESLKQSSDLFIKTWKENAMGKFSMLLVFLPGLVIPVALIFIGYRLLDTDPATTIVFYVASLIVLGFYYVIASCLSRVFETALYLYASTGKSSDYFNEGLLKNAFE